MGHDLGDVLYLTDARDWLEGQTDRNISQLQLNDWIAERNIRLLYYCDNQPASEIYITSADPKLTNEIAQKDHIQPHTKEWLTNGVLTKDGVILKKHRRVITKTQVTYIKGWVHLLKKTNEQHNIVTECLTSTRKKGDLRGFGGIGVLLEDKAYFLLENGDPPKSTLLKQVKQEAGEIGNYRPIQSLAYDNLGIRESDVQRLKKAIENKDFTPDRTSKEHQIKLQKEVLNSLVKALLHKNNISLGSNTVGTLLRDVEKADAKIKRDAIENIVNLARGKQPRSTAKVTSYEKLISMLAKKLNIDIFELGTVKHLIPDHSDLGVKKVIEELKKAQERNRSTQI